MFDIENFRGGEGGGELDYDNQDIGTFRCNLLLAPRYTKEATNNPLFRPQLEYAAPIWHSHQTLYISDLARRKCRGKHQG